MCHLQTAVCISIQFVIGVCNEVWRTKCNFWSWQFNLTPTLCDVSRTLCTLSSTRHSANRFVFHGVEALLTYRIHICTVYSHTTHAHICMYLCSVCLCTFYAWINEHLIFKFKFECEKKLIFYIDASNLMSKTSINTK